MIGLDQIMTIVAVGTLAAGVAFGGYHYREVHLEEFQAIKAEYLYDKCIRECLTVCSANQIKPHRCDCSHCEKYLKGE
jgi:hypothetical protein